MTANLEDVLRKYWGYNSYLPFQKEAMQCVLDNRDSIVVFPTGGGKSLCFQAPALIKPGLAVVVSPLISLMKDQVDALIECGITAARIESTQLAKEQNAVFEKIKNRSLKLLYLSPERLFMNGFMEFLKSNELSFIAIDEAHCVSMWGHDFRPEYRQLGKLKEVFPGIAIHAYTATATERVRSDIAVQLKLNEPKLLIGSFDRPNLVYKVGGIANKLKQVCEIIDRHKGESGIIYCIRRLDVDEMCSALNEMGYKALPYHAGMEDIKRKQNQESFIEEKVDIIVATVAFGMGIDKSNVRYVIHAGMPKSLEHYQQESGRAGRDGLEAECFLLYSGQDFMTWKFIFGKNNPDSFNISMAKLSDIYNYCTGISCRHKALVNYFNQKYDKENCYACDVCLGSLEYIDDSLTTAQKILSCVVRLGENFGAEYTALTLTGSSDKRILNNSHDKLSTYGILSEYPKRIVRDWIEQLTGQGYIRRTGEFNVLEVAEKGWDVIKGKETPHLLKPTVKPIKTSKTAEESWEGVDKELFEELRVLRRQIADSKNIPAYIVFGDAVLRDMARQRPSTRDGFLMVNGIGESKNRQYGKRFIKAIKEYCRTNSVKMDIEPSRRIYEVPSLSSKSRKNVNIAKHEAFRHFSQGFSINKVADKIDRAKSTTTQYLADFIEKEKLTDPYPWVDEKTYKIVKAAACQTDSEERLKPIHEFLNGEIEYDTIRLCMAFIRNEE
ncbi:MAG: DNA helicase RecQ [candidate division Zixibacteria bacterium]|nr:DNA helicase RecQ [candidate division Zixibacteria bacterium]